MKEVENRNKLVALEVNTFRAAASLVVALEKKTHRLALLKGLPPLGKLPSCAGNLILDSVKVPSV